MKEYEVKGLVELKKEYDARLLRLADYTKLTEEFDQRALDLVRTAVTGAGMTAEVSPALAVKGVQPVQGGGGGRCGFCEVCITACTTCVAYAGGVTK